MLRISTTMLCVFFLVTQASAQLSLEVAFPDLSFDRPVDLQHAGDGSDRLYVVEQRGVIRVFENDGAPDAAGVFLDLRDRVRAAGSEEGLLGLAFHPGFEQNGYLYVYYTAGGPRRGVVSRFSLLSGDAAVGDPASEHVVLEVQQPYSNHNGGQIQFGPDGYLYIGLGDGGSGGDPQGNGQNTSSLLGSILRLDIDQAGSGKPYGIPGDNPFAGRTDGTREEIYAYGFRNPWRFSFDAESGRLWTGDVGQNLYEEINVVEKGGNYGWNTMEGFHCFSPSSGCDQTGLQPPVWEYNHSVGRSITGGWVYRGSNASDLTGKYVYGDFVTGRLWALSYDGVKPAVNEELMDTSLNIAAFGVDSENELYLLAFDGRIYRFAALSSGTELPSESKTRGPFQVFPNPASATVTVSFELTQPAPVEMHVYDLLGRVVGKKGPATGAVGATSMRWDLRDLTGRRVPAGTYWMQLRVGGMPVVHAPITVPSR